MGECVKDLTSIIIVAEHDEATIVRCIDSIEQCTTLPYEIIVVENGISCEEAQLLSGKYRIKLMKDSNTSGFLHSRNIGTTIASGDMIVFLQDNAVVFSNWLERLRECLFSNENVGAIGPLTNKVDPHQSVYIDFSSMQEWEDFTRQHQSQPIGNWSNAQQLDRFCFGVKREVLDQCGLFDEAYQPVGFEDKDYCMRIMRQGYRLLFCRDTFVYCEDTPSKQPDGSSYQECYDHGREYFVRKWRFDPVYSMSIRYDLIHMMDETDKNNSIKVLEIGCGSGATLQAISWYYPKAEVYGIEICEGSAAIAKLIGNVIIANIEKIELEDLYQKQFFDYIICGDVLEHLVDPWNAIKKLRELVKDGGYLLSSIPNIMHISILDSLMRGNWTYQVSGLLDQTHLRFFTLAEIQKIFTPPEYYSMEYDVLPPRNMWEKIQLIDELARLNKDYKTDEMYVYQYLIKAKVSHK